MDVHPRTTFTALMLSLALGGIAYGNHQAELMRRSVALSPVWDGDRTSRCPIVDCVAPRQGCRYVNPPVKDGCVVGCGTQKCENTEEKLCFSSAQCADGQICTVDLGECRSACREGQVCIQACAGVCTTRSVSKCGNGICEDGEGQTCQTDCEVKCQTVDCIAPPEHCKHVDAVYKNGCMASCGRLVCDGGGGGSTGPGPRNCEKIVCPDGKTFPRCDEQGMTIPYMDGPCRKEGNTGGVSGGSTGDTPGPVCGNGKCEEGEKSFCPACVYSDPPCMAPCQSGKCPKDCGAGTSGGGGHWCPTPVCAAPPPNCKYVDAPTKDGCPGCGELKCEKDDDHSDCEPIYCKDGSKYPRCSADGSSIAYYRDPCAAPEVRCGDRKLGEVFKAKDGCNTCKCTQDGIVCTMSICAPSAPEKVSCCFPVDGGVGCEQWTKEECVSKRGMAYPSCTQCWESYEKKLKQSSSAQAGASYSMYNDYGWSKASASAEFEDEVRTMPVTLNRFADLDSRTLEGTAANALAEEGIIGGFPDGTFRPEKPVNRAEASEFLLLSKYGEVEDQSGVSFRDLLSGEWYVKYVNAAAGAGIIGGYSDGTFRPAQTVNTAEFLKMLSKTFGLPTGLPHSYEDVPSDAWFASYAGIAEELSLFPGRHDHLSPDRPLTRGETAIAIHRVLEALGE